MAKRFTSTEIWAEDWFLEMPIEYKLFWYYMLANCNHAGIFKVNLRSFCGLNGVNLTSKEIINFFNMGKQRIRIINDSVWLIEDFFFYQYGITFNTNNRVHDSIEKEYNKHGIQLNSIRGLNEVKLKSNRGQVDLNDGVKDKDKDKDKDKEQLLFLNNYNTMPQKKFNDGTVIGEMMKVWMQYNPSYQSDVDNDSHALLDVAHRIAKLKKIEKKELFNGQLKICVDSWETIVKFIRRDDFFKKLELTTIEKKWTGLFQTMEAAKEGSFKDSVIVFPLSALKNFLT